MASEMIERVAIAIQTQLFVPYDSIKLAKAAIAAMREPTKEMIREGCIDPGASGVYDEYTKESYQSMIDAALKE